VKVTLAWQIPAADTAAVQTRLATIKSLKKSLDVIILPLLEHFFLCQTLVDVPAGRPGYNPPPYAMIAVFF
jgi:hypothetical protein